MKKSLSTEKSNILFFDGVCNLCNHWVDFLVSRDKKRTLKFASLQGESAQKMLPKEFTQVLNSLVYFEDGRIYSESSAVLRVLAALGGLWKAGLIFLLVPPSIRNFVYKTLAKNRYNWFGQRETCRLPSPQEKEQFLP